MRRLLLGALILLAVSSTPVQAQFSFFNFKKTKHQPAQRVPELIVTVKTDSDDRKRAAAADELREYDIQTFSEIVPVLVDVLQNDSSASVRQEAMFSLARLRPVTQEAGAALERAASSDDSWKIRLQAKSSLLKYNLAGYFSGKAESPRVTRHVTTAEPPLLDSAVSPAAGTSTQTPKAPGSSPSPMPQVTLPPSSAQPTVPHRETSAPPRPLQPVNTTPVPPPVVVVVPMSQEGPVIPPPQ